MQVSASHMGRSANTGRKLAVVRKGYVSSSRRRVCCLCAYMRKGASCGESERGFCDSLRPEKWIAELKYYACLFMSSRQVGRSVIIS